MMKWWKGLLVGAAACALAFGLCACKPRDKRFRRNGRDAAELFAGLGR